MTFSQYIKSVFICKSYKNSFHNDNTYSTKSNIDQIQIFLTVHDRKLNKPRRDVHSRGGKGLNFISIAKCRS